LAAAPNNCDRGGMRLEKSREVSSHGSTGPIVKPVWGALERYWKPLRDEARKEQGSGRSGFS